ncbi:phosphoesterase, partial [Streptomyces sp. S12]|nr:phosphoesterase [Streptomyces sp. S12]
IIGGTGGLLKFGTGTLSLNGANTFGGGVDLSAGGLMLGNAGALGTGALNVSGNAGFGANVGGLVIGNAINLGSGFALDI